MKKLLLGTRNFERLEILPEKHSSFVINSLDKIENIFKSIDDKESLPDILYKKNWPYGCRSGILYGQTKVHIPAINNCPSFRQIFDPIKNTIA